MNLGLDADAARILSLHTFSGAAKLALGSDESAAVLRARVTSKGGTTERAIVDDAAIQSRGTICYGRTCRGETLARVGRRIR